MYGKENECGNKYLHNFTCLSGVREKKSSKIRAIKMDNLGGLLGISRIEVSNVWIKWSGKRGG